MNPRWTTNTRWTKVRADVLANRLRSGLAIAAMAVGTAAVGATTSAAVTVADSFGTSHLDAHPPSAVLRTEPFDATVVADVAARADVAEAEGRRLQAAQTMAPDGRAIGLELVAMDDFADNRVARIDPLDGAWPPTVGGIVLERASLAELGVDVGDELAVERPGGDPLRLTVIGTAFDAYEIAPMLGGAVRGYIAMDTVTALTGTDHLDTLLLRAADQPLDEAHAHAVATAVREDVLAPAGVAVIASLTDAPSEHRAERSISFVVLAMQLLSGFALVIAVSLVVNTVTALLVQQRQQLGIMKAIGASTRQLATQYVAYVVTLSTVALAVAVPTSVLLGRGIAGVVAGLANIDLVPLGLPVAAIAAQVVLGTALPVAAVLVAVRRASRTTVREAIADRGLTDAPRTSRVRLPLSRPLQLAYRNAVRNRTRTALTVLTVALCGGVLVGVSSTGSALRQLGDEVLGYSAYDVEVALSASVPLDDATAVLGAHAAVEEVEGWLRSEAFLERPDGTVADGISLTAVPADSGSLTPTLLEGRWLAPGDDDAIVVNTHVADEAPDVAVGDRVTLLTEGHAREWRVVGVSSTTLVGPVAYVPVDELAATLDDPGAVNTLAVRLEADADHEVVAEELRTLALDAGLPVAQVTTHGEVRAAVTGLFDVVVALLLLVAVVLAVVAVIGVAGTMTLGVVEQTRELGVLRTLGASSWTLRRMLLLQGTAIAVLGAVLGVALAIPVAAVLRHAISDTLISAAMPLRFSWLGLAVWVATALGIGAIGALQPARAASRQTIRETLAYT